MARESTTLRAITSNPKYVAYLAQPRSRGGYGKNWLAVVLKFEPPEQEQVLAHLRHEVGAEPKLWIWYWTTGGFNSCFADTRKEAMRQATTMTRTLRVASGSLHQGAAGELERLSFLGT